MGRVVEPVSLLHSSAVPAQKLGGRKAEILEPALRRRAKAGARRFLVVPLFLGPSRALTGYIPECVKRLRRNFPALSVRVARPLSVSHDDRLAAMTAAAVETKLTPAFLKGRRARVAVVDHGSPAAAVTRVRNRISAQVRRQLGSRVESVAACSMERRPGEAYDFNEPLLETLLARRGWNTGPVVVAQLFLLPGRHAGPRGDIAAICGRARKKNPGLSIARTRPMGEHPGLVDILADRCSEAECAMPGEAR
ncbi:MAG: CbiX [Verrucomicrobia bacterium]|nr:CbiX [Verrucomicrobiota bacterium]